MNHASALGSGNLSFTDGVLGLGAGDFSRALGTGAGQVQFIAGSGGGWAAYGANRAVNLGGASALVTWNSGGFVLTGDALILGASGADATVDFQNPINLNGAAARTVQVDNGTAAVDATLSGQITGTGSTLSKTGNGTLLLSAINGYSGGLTINAGSVLLGDNFAAGSGLVDLFAGATIAGSGGSRTITNAFDINGTAGGSATFDGTDLTFTASFDPDAAYVYTVNNTTEFSGAISGGDAFTKNGSGTLIFSGAGANTLGTVTVNAGTLRLSKTAGVTAVSGNLTIGDGSGTDTVQLTAANQIANTSVVTLNSSGVLDLNGNDETIGSLTGSVGSSVTLGGGTLTVGDATSTAHAGTISGTGGLTKQGAGTLTLSGVNTYTGKTIINAGALSVSAENNLGDNPVAFTADQLTLNGGTLISTASFDIEDSNRGVTLGASGGTFNVASATTLAISNVIAGAGALTKSTGTGTLVLSAANTYNGNTAINAGVVRLQNNTGLGNTTGTSAVASGAAIQIDGSGLIIGETITSLAGTGGGTGALRNLANNNTWSGPITLGATPRIQSDAGTLTLSGGITGGANALTIGGGGDVTINTTGMSGAGATLTMAGTGTLTLAVTNTYTGVTTISAGTVKAQSNQSFGTSAGGVTVASGAAIQIDGSGLIFGEAITDLAGNGVGGTGGALRNLDNNNAWNGAIAINAAGTRIESASGLLVLGGAITENGTSLVLAFGGNGDIQVTNTITAGPGDLGVLKEGAGVLTYLGTGANTYDQLTDVHAGTLVLSKTAGVNAINGALMIGDSFGGPGQDIVRLNANNQIVDTATVTITNSGLLDLNGFSEAIGSLTGSVGAQVTLGSGTLTNAGTATTIYAGTISGTGGLTKAGTGSLTLSGANSYDGTTTITGGALRAANNTALGSTTGGTTVIGGTVAALELTGGIAVGNETLTLDGTGITGGGALRNISGDNSWAGNITINSATRINSDSGTLTIDVASGNAITGTADNLTFGGAGHVTINDPINTTSGTLTKDGSGTLTLNGANAYTGTTLVSAGVLRAANNTALGTTAAGTTVTGGAVAALELSGNITVGAETLTLDGTGISSGGALRNISGDNSWAGAITINSTTRINSDAGTLTLDVAAGNAITGSADNLNFGGAGNITVNDAIATTTGTLTKDGTGTLTLAGVNTYSGATAINEGVVNVRNAAGLGTVAGGVTVAGGAALELQNTIAVGAEALSLAGTGVGSGGALRNISENNSWAGTVTVAASTRVNSDAGTLTISGAVTETTAGTKTVTVGGGGNVTISGVVGSAGGTEIALVKDGAGTLTLGAATANLYTGGTTLNQGTITMATANALGSGGFTFAGGILQVNNTINTTSLGALTLTADSTLALGVGGASGSLTFASAAASPVGNLLVTGWSGTPGVIGTDDRIFITADPTTTGLLGQIIFDLGGGDLRYADWVSGEVVASVTPVPEPINVALALFGVVFVGVGIGRRYFARSRRTV